VCLRSVRDPVIAHRGASVAEPENTVAAFRAAAVAGCRRHRARRPAHRRRPAGRPPRPVPRRRPGDPHTPAADLPDHVPSSPWRSTRARGCSSTSRSRTTRRARPRPHRLGGPPGRELLERRGAGVRWLDLVVPVRDGVTCGGSSRGDPHRLARRHARRRRRRPHRRSRSRRDPPLGGDPRRTVGPAAHAAGLAVNTWTCDDPDRIGALLRWGVDGICTNVPDVALACDAMSERPRRGLGAASGGRGTRAGRRRGRTELEPVARRRGSRRRPGTGTACACSTTRCSTSRHSIRCSLVADAAAAQRAPSPRRIGTPAACGTSPRRAGRASLRATGRAGGCRGRCTGWC
jgi:hypothetical protein